MFQRIIKILLIGLFFMAGQSVGTSQAEMLFEEYFNNRQLKELYFHTCCWDFIGYENGYLLRQTDPDRQGNTMAITNRSFSGYTVEARVRFANPKIPQFPGSEKKSRAYIVPRMGAGIVFGFNSENHYYIYRLAGEDKVILGKIEPQGWKELRTAEGIRRSEVAETKSVEKSPWMTLRVVVMNGQISCYLNNNLMFNQNCEGDDCSGRIGLTTFKAIADFQYIKAWK